MQICLNKYPTFSVSGLFEAVVANDVSELSAILQKRDKLGYKNFNVNGSFCDISLHAAVPRGDYDMCKMLVECNADVNKMLEYRSPLNVAEEMRNFQIASLLVQNCDQDKSFYKNPLHKAMEEHGYRLCQFHLQNIIVNSLCEKKRTALHVAVMYAPDDICELLIKNGADVCARDIFNDTTLQLSFYYGRHTLRDFGLNSLFNEVY